MPAAVAAIRRERRGRDVYVMGAANVGKSAFIRALVRCGDGAVPCRRYSLSRTAPAAGLPRRASGAAWGRAGGPAGRGLPPAT